MVYFMNDSMNPDFFSKLWKCPIRRCWRYGRKFLFVVTSGIFMWLSLDFFAIVIMVSIGLIVPSELEA